MVVEKRVLMKVVFPKPDSPATWNDGLVRELFEFSAIDCLAHHNRECGSTLGHNLVSENVDLALEVHIAKGAQRGRIYL